MNKPPVKITLELPGDETAWQLAQFVKRVSFTTVLRHTDNGATEPEAHAMLDGLTAVQQALARAGYAPR